MTRVIRRALPSAALCVMMSVPASAQQRCDATRPATAPAGRFRIDDTSATAFDTSTGLTWKLCAERLTFSRGRCRGNVGNSEFQWDEATRLYGAGDGEWRLPTIAELQTIVEKRCAQPAIDLRVFPDTPSVFFWSATTSAVDADYAYDIFFGRGLVGVDLKSRRFYVRLVRGARSDVTAPAGR